MTKSGESTIGSVSNGIVTIADAGTYIISVSALFSTSTTLVLFFNGTNTILQATDFGSHPIYGMVRTTIPAGGTVRITSGAGTVLTGSLDLFITKLPS